MATRRTTPLLRAVLAVGEGHAELAWLRHLKALYLPRGCGTTLKIQGGYGKGGKGVIDYAESVSNGADYAARIVILDTDVDWDDTQRRRARTLLFDVIESEPCIEAWLLSSHGDARPRSSPECKRAFSRRFELPAHDERVYARFFPRETLDAARQRVSQLGRLLDLLRA